MRSIAWCNWCNQRLRSSDTDCKDCLVGDFPTDMKTHLGVWPMGLKGAAAPPPPIIFRAKKVIFGQNHLIFVQAIEKIFGQETSAPLNETRPVRLCENIYKNRYLIIWMIFVYEKTNIAIIFLTKIYFELIFLHYFLFCIRIGWTTKYLA